MQDLDGAIKYWSVAISHVHWARQSKLSRSCRWLPPYLELRMIEGTKSTSKKSYHVAVLELSC